MNWPWPQTENAYFCTKLGMIVHHLLNNIFVSIRTWSHRGKRTFSMFRGMQENDIVTCYGKPPARHIQTQNQFAYQWSVNLHSCRQHFTGAKLVAWQRKVQLTNRRFSNNCSVRKQHRAELREKPSQKRRFDIHLTVEIQLRLLIHIVPSHIELHPKWNVLQLIT